MAETMLPVWMRRALLTTAVMNILVSGVFLPPAGSWRVLAGFPAESHPLYLTTVAMFVLTFGLAYLWAGFTGRADRLFIAVAAGGKLAFFTLVLGFWVAGDVPFRAPFLASADLVFALLFLAWLLG